MTSVAYFQLNLILWQQACLCVPALLQLLKMLWWHHLTQWATKNQHLWFLILFFSDSASPQQDGFVITLLCLKCPTFTVTSLFLIFLIFLLRHRIERAIFLLHKLTFVLQDHETLDTSCACSSNSTSDSNCMFTSTMIPDKNCNRIPEPMDDFQPSVQQHQGGGETTPPSEKQCLNQQQACLKWWRRQILTWWVQLGESGGLSSAAIRWFHVSFHLPSFRAVWTHDSGQTKAPE